jgi:membrane protein YdbS with pleckstrin-like domain
VASVSDTCNLSSGNNSRFWSSWPKLRETGEKSGLALAAGLKRFGTEVAVTDRRVIYKTGLIQRHTVEINLDKIESVDVDQSALGRLFGYGTVTIRGTGQAVEPLRDMADPLQFRSAILAR